MAQSPDHVRPPARRRQALHLRLGRRHRRRPRQDEGSPRRQGRRPRRDDPRRPADPAGLHDHHRGLQRLLRQRQAAAGRPLGRRPGRDEAGRGALRQGLRRPDEPAARLGPLRRQVLDAGHDGHGPQPRPQRGDAPGPHRPDRQRALRLGRLPPLHRACSAGSSWTSRRASSPTPTARRRSTTASTTRSTRSSTRAARSRTRTSPRTPCRELVVAYKAIVREQTGREFPTDVYEQLDLAVKAVFASWFGKRANDYRNSQKIAHDLGTAVNVVTMVFGNMGDDSGTGVAFTRNPNTGEKVLYGEYLTNAQGEDVVAGVRTAPEIAQMAIEMPAVYAEFVAHRPAAREALPRTSRTSSSRSSAASSTCSRPATRSGPPPRP